MTAATIRQATRQWAKEHGATGMHLNVGEFSAGPLPFYQNLGYRTLKRLLVIDLKDN